MPVPAPTRMKLLEIYLPGGFSGHTWSPLLPVAATQCPRLAGEKVLLAIPFTPAGREHPHTQLWGFRLAWPPLWVVSYPRCHCAEGLGGARLPPLLIWASPSLTQHPCHPPRGVGPGLGRELGPRKSPLLCLVPLTFVCLFVLSVPPHWSPVSVEVGGPWAASAPPSPAPPAPLGCV